MAAREGAEGFVGELFAGPLEVGGFGEQPLGDRQHRPSGLGHPDQALAIANEDLDPQFVLQRLDLLADSGLGGEERLGRRGHVQVAARDFGHIAELL